MDLQGENHVVRCGPGEERQKRLQLNKHGPRRDVQWEGDRKVTAKVMCELEVPGTPGGSREALVVPV